MNYGIEGLESGHLHYTALPSLQKMVTGMPEISLKHNGVCKGCALGKKTKKFFSRSKNRSKGILESGLDSFRHMWAYVFTLLEWVLVLCFVHR